MNSKRARVVLNSLVKGGQGDKAGLTGRALKVSSIDRAAPAPKERGPARSRSEFPLRARTREWLIEVTGGHPGLIGASFRLLEQGHQQPGTLQQMVQLVQRATSFRRPASRYWFAVPKVYNRDE